MLSNKNCTSFPNTMMASSSTLIAPTTSTPKPFSPTTRSKLTTPSTTSPSTARREFLSLAAVSIITPPSFLFLTNSAWAASDDEYVKETTEVINKVRSTLTLDRTDPNVAEAVSELRDTSNSWVAKYRKEKALLGRASFRDMYSALNAVSGHYISFGPTAPIPAKRKQRILEEMDTAEKALLRGR